MVTHAITRNDSDYPIQIDAYLEDRAPPAIAVAGPRNILARPMLALLCSSRVPGRVLDRLVDAAQWLRKRGVTIVSGFHSPVEKETLRVFLCSPHPLVVCWARGMPGYAPKLLRERYLAGGVLFLSPFPDKVRRATRASCRFRNRLTAALAGSVFVPHAQPGSQTRELVRTLLCRGMPVFTLDMPENDAVLAMGAQPLTAYSSHCTPARTVSMSGPSLWS